MKLLQFAVFFIITSSLFSQNGEIIYAIEMRYKKDQSEHHMVKGVKKEFELLSFTLRYNTQKSNFGRNKSIEGDKLYSGLAKVFSETYNETWFQVRETNENFVNIKIMKKQYQEHHNRMTDWVITDETKIIEGYTCFKAVRKELNVITRKPIPKYFAFEAWFTPEIPVPYGPVGNGGLPGLILRLEKKSGYVYTATKITLNKKKIKLKEPIEYTKITVKERNVLMNKERMVTPD